MSLNKKILFVDDEPIYTQVYSQGLEARGHQVEKAENGEEALEKLKSGHFDLLIVDLVMPILSGISFLKKIRHRKIPIIVFTTLEGETDREDAIKYGAKSFIKKGETDVDQLSEIVDDLLSKN